MKYRLLAVLVCAIFLCSGITPVLAEELALPTVTIRYYEEGIWYPLLVPNDTLLTAEALPDFITGVDSEDQRWEVPVHWDVEEHQAEISSYQDFNLYAREADTLVGPGDTTYQIRIGGPAAEPFSLPVYYFQRGPIGTDPKLSGLTGSYAPWRGKLTLSYNIISRMETTPPDAEKVLIQVSTDQAHWETVLDVTGEARSRFDVDVPNQRVENLYYRIWVEGGPQAGASTEYVVMEANAELSKVHTVTLEDDLVVGAGEQVIYQTVDETLLDAPENGLYPGELTIQVNSRIVVEAGGNLTIGTYASGGPEERPTIRGTLSQDGLIQVEPGGILELDGVAWELEGEEGCAIQQEDGAVVKLYHTDLDTNLVQWGAPLIDNSELTFEDIWLEVGSPLTEWSLPREADTWVLDRGALTRAELPIRWELEEHEGPLEGTAVISGAFLDEAGEPMSALAPLEVVIHWYAPEEIPVTGTAWLGDAAPTARLQFSTLPDQAAEIWGEWSEDGEKTWTRLEQCEFKENNQGPYCVLRVPDSTPRLYRVAAVSADGTRHWASKGVLLPDADTDPEDPDGNRGGSTGVVHPDREPEPETPPAPDAAPPVVSDPELTPDPSIPPVLPASPEPAQEQERDTTSEAPFEPPSAPAESSEVPDMIPSPSPQQGQERPDEADQQASAMVPSLPPEAGTTPEPHQSPPPAPTAPTQPPAQTMEPDSSATPSPLPDSPAPSVPAGSEGKDQSPPKSVQTALAAVGLGGCVLAGLGLTRSGPFKKKK